MPDRFPLPSNNAVGRQGPSLSVMREAAYSHLDLRQQAGESRA